jgi:cyclopropane-fatty-acyl-phospholipid synthase
MSYKSLVLELGKLAGVSTGQKPWDITVYNPKFYERLICQGSLGLGESYMEGWWDCNQLDEFFYRIIKAKTRNKIYRNFRLIAQLFIAKIFNQQNLKKSKRVAKQHYDLDIELFKKMLGETMSYSCGYWKNAQTLEQAQNAKFELICKKLNLKENEKVLDIGSGFGGLSKYMAEKYNCKVTGVNISKSQHDYANSICGNKVNFCFCDYRHLENHLSPEQKFDKIVSVGMFEHIGPKNFKKFFNIMQNRLKYQGLLLLHTIGAQEDKRRGDPWILKYIFPGGIIPRASEITKHTDKLFILEDWHNFGFDYYKTLKAWFNNFDKYWTEIKQKNKDDEFYKMWKYYLLMCAGVFKARENSLWQIVFSKGGVPGGYVSIR